ncbi:hypothetical protein M758_4G099300 [Ceratodon purpureus]|nr:hypothetical protein M758_4G099300 [Ceratodon purpureus]
MGLGAIASHGVSQPQIYHQLRLSVKVVLTLTKLPPNPESQHCKSQLHNDANCRSSARSRLLWTDYWHSSGG